MKGCIVRSCLSRLQKLLLCLCFIFSLSGCGNHEGNKTNPNGDPTSSDPKLVQISITPLEPNIDINEQQQFVAIGTFSDQTTKDVTSQVIWESSDPEVAAIESASGLTTGLGYGSSQISAFFLDVHSNKVVLKIEPKIAKIEITTSASKILVGNALQFSAVATYSDGIQKIVTNQVSWKSSNSKVAVIDEFSGLAKGIQIGSTEISASLGPISSGRIFLSVSSHIPEF